MEYKQKVQDKFWRDLEQKYEERTSELAHKLNTGSTSSSTNLASECSGCGCSRNQKFEDQDDQDPEDESVFSLNSEDLLRMSRIKQLYEREKELKEKIQQMEKRELDYAKTFVEKDKVLAEKESEFVKCLCNSQLKKENDPNSLEATHIYLTLENKRLAEELSAARREMKAIIERVEGPINEQATKEWCKRKMLEREVVNARKQMEEMSKGDESLEDELTEATKNVRLLGEINSKLKKEMCDMQCRYNDLLAICTKQKEEHEFVVNELKLSIQRKLITCQECCICGGIAEPTKISGEFKDMAQKLDNAIGAINNCPHCKQAGRENAKETAMGIKSVLEIIDKSNGDIECSCCSCQQATQTRKDSCDCKKPETQPVKDESSECTSLKDACVCATLDKPPSSEIGIEVDQPTRTNSCRCSDCGAGPTPTLRSKTPPPTRPKTPPPRKASKTPPKPKAPPNAESKPQKPENKATVKPTKPIKPPEDDADECNCCICLMKKKKNPKEEKPLPTGDLSVCFCSDVNGERCRCQTEAKTEEPDSEK